MWHRRGEQHADDESIDRSTFEPSHTFVPYFAATIGGCFAHHRRVCSDAPGGAPGVADAADVAPSGGPPCRPTPAAKGPGLFGEYRSSSRQFPRFLNFQPSLVFTRVSS